MNLLPSLRFMVTTSIGVALLSALPLAQAADGLKGDIKLGKGVFGQCAACHQVGEKAQNAFGPVLTDVVGRPAGTAPDYKYSGSLKAAGEKGLVWDEEQLFKWLNGPSAFLQEYLDDKKASSNMPVHFEDEDERKNVIAYLSSLNEAKSAAGEKMAMADGAEKMDGHSDHGSHEQQSLKGDVKRGKEEFGQCAACHQVGEGAQHAFGPLLTGVVGRPAGSEAGYKYSGSLKAAGEKGLVWDEAQLFEWLSGPSAFLQKYLGDEKASSNMPVKFDNEQQRQDIIAYLSTIKKAKLSVEEQAALAAEAGEVSHGDAPFPPDLINSQDRAESKAIDERISKLKRVKQELVAPPFMPEHSQTAEGEPKLVEIELTVQEKKWVLDNKGTEFVALTFNGSIPAPGMVVHQGDYVELTLRNPSTNLMEHNIDLHAVTGALGGAGITTISPGEEAVIRFHADRSGAFLYHCAPEGSMTPYHATHGMTGTILVLPRDGLKDDEGNRLEYDKVYHIGENDFYVPKDEDGNYKTYERAGEDFIDWVNAMHTLTPTHIVFNGRAGALTGKNSMKANVGERVLFLHMQGNRDTRPHLIGGHGDYVWETGSFTSPPLKDQETWLVRGGSVGAALYTFKQPGIYVYLNHNLIESVELGAAAHVIVEGDWNEDLLKQMYKGPIRE